ncbi:hypothetical protein AVL56_02945 [Alteromonas stellipolaris]|nr:hypothetical protein AVL56_02945 [Alteromonas stellipolaris]
MKRTYEVPFLKKHSRVDLGQTSTYCLGLATADLVDSKAGCIVKVDVLEHRNWKGNFCDEFKVLVLFSFCKIQNCLWALLWLKW